MTPNNYLVDQVTHKVLKGPMESEEVVDWIRSRGPLCEQAKYYNASRYALAKNGHYPMNKAGHQALIEDLAASPITTIVDAAPDLLSVVTRFNDMWTRYQLRSPYEPMLLEEYEQLLLDARAAIAKAEGNTP